MPAVPLPLVTIVIPAFNHERYVAQTLDSCLDSGLPDVEIIACDDASDDQTPAIIEEWMTAHRDQFRRLHFIRHAKNIGLCGSLNELVREASGEFIHLIDSDDYFLPGGLLAKTRAMADHPDWLAAFCDGQAVGPEGELFHPSIVTNGKFIPSRLTPDGMAEELLYHWGPPVHQLTWRRSAFKSHGGDYEYDATVFCEDYDSALWAAGHKALGYIPAICQAYRYRSFPPVGVRDPIRVCRDNAHVLAKHAHRFEPHVRAAYRLFSQVQANTAIGDTACSGYLEQMHKAGHAAYLHRVATAAPYPPPAQEAPFADDSILIDALRNQIRSLEEKLARRKSEIQRYKLACQVELTRLREQLADTTHQLRYHAASPPRALRLWWNKPRLP